MSKFQLTEEQKEIIESEENIIVEARAGTGKTTTLIHYALKHNNKKKIYLAFNKSIKEEADIKFTEAGVKNIVIATTHGIAYTQVIKSENYKFNNSTNVFSLMKHYDKWNSHKLMLLAFKRFNAFCDSSHRDITSFDYSSLIQTASGKRFYENNINFVNEMSNKIWTDMLNKRLDCSHNFYLKKFQLDDHVLKYDIIMVDECLPYNSQVLLSDGTYLPIGEIVDNKLNVEVLSYNSKTKKQEPVRIINWSKNSTHNKMYRIIFEDRVLECTHNHKVYVSGISNKLKDGTFQYEFYSEEDRWVEASQLKINQYCQMSNGQYSLIKDIEIKRFKEEFTYDITVENNHNFYANGILVHNCQDLNEVVYDIIKNQTCRIVAVGDSEQAIYGWRGAVDAMEKFPFKRLTLTQSFRFPQTIADLGLKVLSFKEKLKEDYDFSKIKLIGKGISDGKIETRAIISRSNLALLDRLITGKEKYILPYIEGKLESLTKLQLGFDILDLYFLYCKKREKINSNFIKKFKTFEDLQKYYEDLDDMSLSSINVFFEKYFSNLELELSRIEKILVDDKYKADWVFSTIHKSKGNEYDFVEIISPPIWELGFPNFFPPDEKFFFKIVYLINKYIPSSMSEHKVTKDKLKELKEYTELSNNLITSIDTFLLHNKVLDTKDKISKFKSLYCNFPNTHVVEGLDFIVNYKVEELNKKRNRWIEELNIYYVAITRAKKQIQYDIHWLDNVLKDEPILIILPKLENSDDESEEVNIEEAFFTDDLHEEDDEPYKDEEF